MSTSSFGQNERAPTGLSDLPFECRTIPARPKVVIRAAVLGFLLAVAPPARGTEPGWPPFLAPRETFGGEVVATVERIWADPTLARTVQGRSARVPLDTYIAFVDSPEVTAAAARFLKLARYEVQALDEAWYRASDNDGARGLYRILAREPRRRIILSWGEHSSLFLGTIRGSALTVLDLASREDAVGQAVTAYVLIENRVAAALARVLITLFGGLADRKLAEGFAVTARVAEWAVERPGEFCGWLAREPLPLSSSERVAPLLCPELEPPEGSTTASGARDPR